MKTATVVVRIVFVKHTDSSICFFLEMISAYYKYMIRNINILYSSASRLASRASSKGAVSDI